MACATLMTSSLVLLTRTKNVIRMSARMLSWQISPSCPVRSISIVFTEMSIVSALCSTGSTTAPVNVTCTLRTFETISALPCSTLWNRRLMATSRMSSTASATPPAIRMGSIVFLSGGAGPTQVAGATQKNSPSMSYSKISARPPLVSACSPVWRTWMTAEEPSAAVTSA